MKSEDTISELSKRNASVDDSAFARARMVTFPNFKSSTSAFSETVFKSKIMNLSQIKKKFKINN